MATAAKASERTTRFIGCHTLNRNSATAKAALRATLRRLPAGRDCECAHALRHALFTAPELVPEETKRELQPIIGKYMGK